MSHRLSEEEKRQRQILRDERKTEKDANPSLDERCYEILLTLRGAEAHPEVKYNSHYFERRFGVSNITVLRAIKKLKDLDLIEERQVKGSYAIKKEAEQMYSSETRRNIALVASMKGLLRQYQGTPLFESVQKLIYFLEPKVAKEDSLLSSSRVAVPPQMEYNINIRNWDKVYEAMQKNCKICFRYTSPYTNADAVRTVCPYQLLLDNATGTVYLFAHSDYHDVDNLYTLSRMADIVVTDETFSLPEDYDFASRCAGGRLGAFKGSKTEKYRIRFTGYAKFWIKEHKWADDQQFKEDEESTTITFSSNQSDRIFEMILGWGAMAEPLAPKRLVKRWKDEIAKLYEKAHGAER